MMSLRQRIRPWLATAYDASQTEQLLVDIDTLLNRYAALRERPTRQLSECDALLITYGDQVQSTDEPPLATLKRFLDEEGEGLINSVHILPFYPYSSDDGFSVIDYYQVHPEWGDWPHIKKLGEGYKLMFDGVINHISQESAWFKDFLARKEPYTRYFTEDDPAKDYSQVVRPRTLPLLHDYVDADGETRYVWTTFSRDQVDLNYREPAVLLQILDLLLFYASQGARLVRLDAIGFMWKEDDSSCIHLPQTHNLIKVMRAVVGELASDLIFITETNVPHEENISYFGNGHDEAQMVYNFTLPPLLAFSLLQGNAAKFNAWARSLVLPSQEVCFFNFTASHDGVGLRPVTGILNEEEVEVLTSAAEVNGGRISYRTTSDGGQSPYEINCNYLSLLKGEGAEPDKGCKRMILSQAVMLAFPGMPAIYFHSLVGSQNDLKGMATSGINRRINREKLQLQPLQQALRNDSVRSTIFSAFKSLLRVRNACAAFHPLGRFSFPDYGDGIIAIERSSIDGDEKVLCLFNVEEEPHRIINTTAYTDLLTGADVDDMYTIESLGYRWLRVK